MDIVSPSFPPGEGVMDTAEDTSNSAYVQLLKRRNKHALCLTTAK